MPDRSAMRRPFGERRRILVLDTETAGFRDLADAEPGEILQLSVADLDGSPPRSWRFQPQEPDAITDQALLFCKMSRDELNRHQTFEAHASVIAAELGNAVLVAHNAAFDERVIRASFDRTNVTAPIAPWIDSLELALLVFPELERHNVDALAEVLGLPTDPDRRHTAEADVLEEREILKRLLVRWDNYPNDAQSALLACLPRDTALRQLLESRQQHRDNPPKTIRGLVPPPFLADGHANEENSTPEIAHCPFPETADPADDFRPSGFLASMRDDFTPRDAQVEFVQLYADLLRNGGFGCIEAGTGTGKSLAYAVPACRHARRESEKPEFGRTIVSTYTKVLQTQLRRDLRAVAKQLGVKVAVLKGRQNYVDLGALDRVYRRHLSAESANSERATSIAILLAWAIRPSDPERDEFDGDLDSISYAALRLFDESMSDLIRSIRSARTGRQHSHFRNTIDVNIARAKRSSIIITNHMQFFRSPRIQGLARNVVFDEAHHIEDGATDAMSPEIAAGELRSWIDEVRDVLGHKSGDDVSDAHTAVALLVVESARFLDRRVGKSKANMKFARSELVPRTWPRDLLAAYSAMGNAISKLRASLDVELSQAHSLLDDDTLTLQYLLDRAKDLENRIEAVYRDPQLDRNFITVCYEDERDIALEASRHKHFLFKAHPIDVASILKKDFWEADAAPRSALFTSATLTVGLRDFSFFCGRIGLDDVRTERVFESPFDLARNMRAIITTYIPAPTPLFETPFVESLASVIHSAALTIGSGKIPAGTLTLLTSRHRLVALEERLRERFAGSGVSLITQGGGRSARQAIDEYKSALPAVLLGLSSMWEGVDLPGHQAEIVVVGQIPFPRMDPLTAARATSVDRLAPNAGFDRFLLPLAILRMKQGAGRLIRSEHDKGIVVLADQRIRYAEYGERIRTALGIPESCFLVSQSLGATVASIAKFLDLSPEERLPKLPQASTLDLGDPIEAVLPRLEAFAHDAFGYDSLKGSQRSTLELLLQRRDVIATLQTGYGKSAIFQILSLAMRDGLTVVVEPLKAITAEQTANLAHFNNEVVRVAAWTGSVSNAEKRNIERAIEADELRLLYVVPESLEQERLLRHFRGRLRYLVIDEAHCIIVQGETFRPSYLRLCDTVTRRLRCHDEVTLLALTGTLSKDDRRMIEVQLGMNAVTITEPSVRDDILVSCDRLIDDSKETMLEEVARSLCSVPRGVRSIVFTFSRAEAAGIARTLRDILAEESGKRVAFYHAQLPQDRLDELAERFANGEYDVIVATTALGMGVDVDNVGLVVHTFVPASPEDYYQQVGRAARQRLPDNWPLGRARMLYRGSDLSGQSREPSRVPQGLVNFLTSKAGATRAYRSGIKESTEAKQTILLLEWGVRRGVLDRLRIVPGVVITRLQPGVTIDKLRNECGQHDRAIDVLFAEYKRGNAMITLDELASDPELLITLDSSMLRLSTLDLITYEPRWATTLAVYRLARTCSAGDLIAIASGGFDRQAAKRRAMTRIASDACPRRALAEYFGDNSSPAACLTPPCGSCSQAAPWESTLLPGVLRPDIPFEECMVEALSELAPAHTALDIAAFLAEGIPLDGEDDRWAGAFGLKGTRAVLNEVQKWKAE